jgi:hypothetical protein
MGILSILDAEDGRVLRPTLVAVGNLGTHPSALIGCLQPLLPFAGAGKLKDRSDVRIKRLA